MRTTTNMQDAIPALPEQTVFKEAVGVFLNPQDMEDAFKDLQENGFNAQNISILARDKTVKNQIGHIYNDTREAEDDPEAPRGIYIAKENIREAKGVVFGLPLYIGAVVGAALAAAARGTMLEIGLAALGGSIAGGLAGGLLARYLHKSYTNHLSTQIKRGGLILWVGVSTSDEELKACEIMEHHGARDVHIHDMPIDTYGLPSEK